MAVIPESLATLRLRTSAKWTTYPEDVLPLFVAEMDFPLAEPIAEALHAAIRRSDTGYLGLGQELQEAFAAFADRRWGWPVDPSRVHTTIDVSMGIVEVLRRVLAPGGEVVIAPPVYAPFCDLVSEAGGRVREVPLTYDGDVWSLDLLGLERAFADGARVFLLCNPHNPLGHPHAEETLQKVAELADTYGVTVISDEIHAPLVHSDGVYTPYLTVSDAARNHGVAITSASKGWNLAGLKCALIVSGSLRMNNVVAGMYEEVFWRTSIFGAAASTAAFTHAEAWLDGAVATIEHNKQLLTSLLQSQLPEVRYAQPSASYLAWLDFRALGWGEDPSAIILERAKVALNPGPSFGRQGAGFARLNFACSTEVLTEAVQRIAAIR
ncbi:MAG: aspartate aminotransferase [Homoserinimonas sp.]|nr:aspartate aminotransferase [Homoserinimonas sp.]